ncbi:MAG: TonB-dependent receptor plug domain-containing protein [Spirochaetes bacterium]|nr:TonB-dependent receptor plug domain-containing protein [Spirochaetota bacterium]
MRVFIAVIFLTVMPALLFAQQPAAQKEKTTPEERALHDDVVPAADNAAGEDTGEETKKIRPIEEIIVKSNRETRPSKTVIDVESAQPVGSPQNIMDLLGDQSMLDYRGKTNLVPDDDTYYLRGFGSDRFASSIDGMTIRKTGGRKSSHVVDYALLPPWLIERVEILPGPHSALYPGKAIGGVINFITKTPKKFKTLKPDIGLSAGYGSYNTQIYNGVVNGAVESFIYDLGFQRYSTNGNLRQSDAAINNFYGRIGGVFPRDGFFTASHSYSRADRQIPVNNNLDVMRRDPLALFDPDYPLVFNSEFNNWQNPTWNKVANTTRLNFCQPTPFGTIRATGYYGKENRDRRYPAYINKKNPAAGVYDASWETIFWQYGGRVEYEITYADDHTTTAAFDYEKLEDGCGRAPSYSLMAYRKKERVGIMAGALQHRWNLSKIMDFTAGLRYEDVNILVSNFTTSGYKLYITGKPTWIRRHWAGIIPKSFTTFKFDKIAEFMRDTSVSVGVSRIWHAPDYHGTYNPQGRPAGRWLRNEDGVGYDFIVTRRIWRDITFQARYYLYDIIDYFAHNSAFSFFSGKTAPAGFEYKDYVVNLERVHRHGIGLDLHGEIIDGLSFHTSYTYQEFRYKGKSLTDRLTAKIELDGQAKHHFKAGVRYLLEYTNTAFMADYGYESEQVYMNPVEVAAETYVFYATRNNPFHLLDIAIEQTLLKDQYYFRHLRIKLFIRNILNDIYQDDLGYQMPGRTYGGEISMKF